MFGLETAKLIEFSFKAVTNSIPAGGTGNMCTEYRSVRCDAECKTSNATSADANHESITIINP